MGDVDLQVEGNVGRRALQKVCQTPLHQLREENGLPGAGVLHCSQEPDDVGVLQVSQNLALLLKSGDKVSESRGLGVHGDSVEDLSSTWLVVQRCLHHVPVGS